MVYVSSGEGGGGGFEEIERQYLETKTGDNTWRQKLETKTGGKNWRQKTGTNLATQMCDKNTYSEMLECLKE